MTDFISSNTDMNILIEFLCECGVINDHSLKKICKQIATKNSLQSILFSSWAEGFSVMMSITVLMLQK